MYHFSLHIIELNISGVRSGLNPFTDVSFLAFDIFCLLMFPGDDDAMTMVQAWLSSTVGLNTIISTWIHVDTFLGT